MIFLISNCIFSFGTNDGGHTMYDTSPDLKLKLDEIGAKLNLVKI